MRGIAFMQIECCGGVCRTNPSIGTDSYIVGLSQDPELELELEEDVAPQRQTQTLVRERW